MPRARSGLAVRPAGPAPSNVDVVAAALRQALLSGRLSPGDRIKEIPLAEQLGVSRGPIREAIRLLEHDGLLRIVPNRGAVVPEVATTDLFEVYAMRAALGSLALHKLLLGEAGPPLEALERELGRLRRAVAQRLAGRAAEADLEYQSAVVAAAGMPRVRAEWERLTWQVRIWISTLHTSYEDLLPQMLREVEDLHAAIVARDVARAERVWRDKFERWVRHFVAQLAEGFDAEMWAALTSGSGLGGHGGQR